MEVKKIAIVLFNLGGPKNLDSVKPFLFSLFYDKAIISLPNPLRFLIAKIISIARSKKSQQIYSLIGNGSPILTETTAQKLALSNKLKKILKDNFDIFLIMRHSEPRAQAVVHQIKNYNPSEIILLPLYPQFSSTTTGSALNDFNNYKKLLSNIPIKTICCYPMQRKFIRAHVSLIVNSITKLKSTKNFRILFSAHGLPVKIIDKGDPYQWQVEQTVRAIVLALNAPNLDYIITYQSKIGPTRWLKPNTQDEIENAGKIGKSLVIVPISFVSEHVETLVELDIEYKRIADKYKVQYVRVPALGINHIFIDSLTEIISNLAHQNGGDDAMVASSLGKRLCPGSFSMCICTEGK